MAYPEKQKTELINTICDRISKGEALRNVLMDKNMPDAVTFYSWIDVDNEKIKQYARATELRAESMFEDILNIADNQESDVIEVDGKEIINHDIINRARLRVDSRKWILSKMQPKKYGDKLDLGVEVKKPIEYINVSKQFPNKK